MSRKKVLPRPEDEDLSLEIQPTDDDAIVRGDNTALRRVVDILLDNAFEYTPAPGSVQLSLERTKDCAVICVRDSGPGIDKRDRDKSFERFYRLDQARGRDQGGAGLGLAIAQWIVSQHHGSIAVESRPGEGTVFRVELSVIAAHAKSQRPV
jgi:two-component system, OmpR family, sensor histidine kinase CiaH